MQSRRRRKKVGDGRCRRRARRSRSSVRPMPFEIADGAPVSGNQGNTAMAAVPRASRLENGNGADPARHCTTTLILATTANFRPWGDVCHAALFPHHRGMIRARRRRRTSAAHRRPDVLRSCGRAVSPGLLCQPAAFERSGPIFAGVAPMRIESGPFGSLTAAGRSRNGRRRHRCVSTILSRAVRCRPPAASVPRRRRTPRR